MVKEEIKKSIFKKWWFWALIVILLAFIIPTEDESEETNANADENEQEESNVESNNGIPGKDEEEKTIEINKEIELDNINIGIENVYIEDGKIRFGFWWNHWSSKDSVHFTVLAYPIVEQNGKELGQEDKNNTLLRQTEKGVDSRVDLEYELIDDSPVTITFKTTTDDPIEETIEVDIE